MNWKVIIIITILTIFCTGCNHVSSLCLPKLENTTYEEKTFIIEEPVRLEIVGQTGNIEIYNQKGEEVRFEITKKIKCSRNENLEKKFENFEIITKKNEIGEIFLEWKYKGQNKKPLDKSVDLRIYLPKKIKSITCKLDIGRIKIYDDVRYNILANLNMANIDINRFEGVLVLQGEMSNLKINGGLLKSGSKVNINMGNINIKTQCENNGVYEFQTKIGNVDLAFPVNSKICFENRGYVQNNDFEIKDYPVKILVESEMGRICINKY